MQFFRRILISPLLYPTRRFISYSQIGFQTHHWAHDRFNGTVFVATRSKTDDNGLGYGTLLFTVARFNDSVILPLATTETHSDVRRKLSISTVAITLQTITLRTITFVIGTFPGWACLCKRKSIKGFSTLQMWLSENLQVCTITLWYQKCFYN